MYHVCCGGVMVINKTFEHLTVFVFNCCYTTWNIKQNNLQKSRWKSLRWNWHRHWLVKQIISRACLWFGGVPPQWRNGKKYQILQYFSMLYWYSGDLERLQRVYCRISTLNEWCLRGWWLKKGRQDFGHIVSDIGLSSIHIVLGILSSYTLLAQTATTVLTLNNVDIVCIQLLYQHTT